MSGALVDRGGEQRNREIVLEYLNFLDDSVSRTSLMDSFTSLENSDQQVADWAEKRQVLS